MPVALKHEEDGGSRKTYGPNHDLGGTRYRGVGLLVTFATSRYWAIEIVESVERGWGCSQSTPGHQKLLWTSGSQILEQLQYNASQTCKFLK